MPHFKWLKLCQGAAVEKFFLVNETLKNCITHTYSVGMKTEYTASPCSFADFLMSQSYN